VVGAFARPYFANWTPLTSISIAIDNALYGVSARGVLVTNVVLHALATLLLFLALLRMTGKLGRSACVAGLFALHPLHVESVAWASQRKDVLAGVFFMGALLAHARYAERGGAARQALVVGCAALALLAKPTAVTLPFALLLLDGWPLQRLVAFEGVRPRAREGWRRVLVEKLPLLGLAAAASVLTWWAQTAGGAGRSDQVSLGLRLANAALAYADYLRDAVWPSGLAAFYPYPIARLRSSEPAVAVALLLAITAVCAWRLRRQPYLLVGWLWFLGTLVPAIGLVQIGGQARADRYMYLPLVGVALAATWGIGDALRGLRRARAVGAALACAAVAACGLVAHAQVRHWRDSVALFERAIAVTEGNHPAHAGLAAELHARGDLAGAERHAREALRIDPKYGDAHVTLGAVLADSGRTDEARREIERGIATGALPARAHATLGQVAEQTGDLAGAVSAYREALRHDPAQYEALNNLAWVLATAPDPSLRDPVAAVRLAETALARRPDDAPVLDTAAAAYAAAGRPQEAVRTQERALAALGASGDTAAEAEYRARLDRYRAQAGGAAPAR
jgi:tetratricopeptide (TPR) repeat protein